MHEMETELEKYPEDFVIGEEPTWWVMGSSKTEPPRKTERQRSFVVKHAGFDYTKSETFLHQSKRTPICRCIQYTIVPSFDHQRTIQLPHLRIAQLSSINGLATKVHHRGLLVWVCIFPANKISVSNQCKS